MDIFLSDCWSTIFVVGCRNIQHELIESVWFIYAAPTLHTGREIFFSYTTFVLRSKSHTSQQRYMLFLLLFFLVAQVVFNIENGTGRVPIPVSTVPYPTNFCTKSLEKGHEAISSLRSRYGFNSWVNLAI